MLSLDVTTANGERFSTEQSADLAYMVYRRFGRNIPAAVAAWRRLLENNCDDVHFEALLALSMSEKDLVDVSAFFTSPLGPKFLAIEPIFFQKLQDVVSPWRQDLSTDIVTRAREDMKKKGADF